MNESETLILNEEIRSPGRLFLPSLSISYFMTYFPILIVGILLIDIGETFEYSVGVTGQLQTGASLITMVSAALMGAWSIRFEHRSLLLAGLLVTSLAAVGCSFALNFPMLFLFFTLSGLGTAMIEPMMFALIGEHFPLKQRSHAIGWAYAGLALGGIIITPIISVIAGVGGERGWRWAFLALMLPSTLLCFVLAAKKVPSHAAYGHQLPKDTKNYWDGFKGIFTNHSATACLVGNTVLYAGWQVILFYSATFFRDRFLDSVGFVSLIVVGGIMCYMLGNLIGGRVVNRLGRKPTTILTAFLMGIFIASFLLMSNFWLALTFNLFAAFFGGVRATSTNSLTLEQVPEFRGSMMSLTTAAMALGAALGAGVGGLTLDWWDWEGIGLVMGALCLVAVIIFYLFVSDPTSKAQ